MTGYGVSRAGGRFNRHRAPDHVPAPGSLPAAAASGRVSSVPVPGGARDDRIRAEIQQFAVGPLPAGLGLP